MIYNVIPVGRQPDVWVTDFTVREPESTSSTSNNRSRESVSRYSASVHGAQYSVIADPDSSYLGKDDDLINNVHLI